MQPGLHSNNSSIVKIGFFLLLLALTLASTYGIVLMGPTKGIAIAGGVIGIAIGLYSIINYVFGFYAGIALGFFVFFFARLTQDSIPPGVIIDLQILVTFMGLVIHKIINRESLFKHAGHIITYIYIVYTLYLMVQLFNPNMYSVAGWVLIVRKFLQFLLVYLIALNIFSDINKVKTFFKIVITLAFIVGAYGCYQEWFGLLKFESDWIWSDNKRVGLYRLYDGTFRKFSFLSDPAAFGITMAAFSLLVMPLFLAERRMPKKILLFLALVFMLLGVAYSGTRTSYFIIVVGVLFYIMLTIHNTRTIVFAAVFAVLFVGIVWGPIYGNTTINRIRSTFEFSEDGSMEVRDINRKFIQPYILSHPIGGGLATSGAQGLHYNPGHYLAGFPPDSGYIKSAIETGWIGLFLQCLIYFIIMRSGVREYFRARDEQIKQYYIVVLVCLFSFVVAQYSQEAIAQIPGFFLFYSGIALIVRMRYF